MTNPEYSEVNVDMGDVQIIKSGTEIVENGISRGACVLAIAKLGSEGRFYRVSHIIPGQIERELKAMLKQSDNKQVTVFQSNVQGIVDDLASSGQIFTNERMIKSAFRDRDKGAGGLY